MLISQTVIPLTKSFTPLKETLLLFLSPTPNLWENLFHPQYRVLPLGGSRPYPSLVPPSPSLVNPPHSTNVNHITTTPQPTPSLLDHQLNCGQPSSLHATTSNPSPLLPLTPTIPLTEGAPPTTTQPSLPFVTHPFTHAPLINESQVDLTPINIPTKVTEVFRCSAPDFFGDDCLANFDSHTLKSAQAGTDLSLSNAIKQQSSLSKKR
ncbi:hypothetical protein RHSIM_Rhsim11G0089200 [Rhododendron simsii]|uniref:Uncharacterized protein n=1 Tax=Rhododendron simsii TaxID=118357 RepID=A0A834GC77_RHOSS|nr:hypothetical protein RHSIM_Rhsim11G0089200 [Rhododendron simsii]